MKYVTSPGYTIEMDRLEERAEFIHPIKKPDPSWKHIDKNGHAHVWDGKKLPTLTEVRTGTGYYDDGTDYPITEYQCRVCNEPVEPGHRLDYSPQIILGPPRLTLRTDRGAWAIGENDARLFIEIMDRITKGTST